MAPSSLDVENPIAGLTVDRTGNGPGHHEVATSLAWRGRDRDVLEETRAVDRHEADDAQSQHSM
jgi:hypothetical protein